MQRHSQKRPVRHRFFDVLEHRWLLATHIWTGAASNLWSDGGNWTGGSPAGDAQAILSFPGGVSNLASTNDLAGLTVSAIDFSGGGYALSGNAITLVQGPLGAPRLHADAPVSNNSLALDLNRLATNLGITFDVATGSTLSISGAISGGAAASSIVKDGSGKLVLSGDNSFADQVLLNAGTLNIRNSLALGTTAAGDGNRTTINGGTLEIEGNLFVLEPLFQGAAGGALHNLSGITTWTGDIFLSANNLNAQVDDFTTLSITGVISDNSAGPILGLTKNGFGKLFLTNANTYRGLTTVNGGILNINNPLALGTTDNGTTVQENSALELQGFITVASETLGLEDGILRSRSGDNKWQGPITLSGTFASLDALTGSLTVDGVISGTGNLNIVDDAPAKVILTQANTYTGATTILGRSILNIRNPLALGQPGGPSVTIADAGTLELELQATNNINEALSLIGSGISGTGALRNISGTNNWTGNVLLNFSNPTIGVSGGELVIGGVISQAPGGDRSITKVGGGALFLNANNTYTGATLVIAGSLFVNGTILSNELRPLRLSGGRLGGNGTVGNIYATSGVVNPGVDGAGHLTASRGASFEFGSTFEVDLNGTIPGTGYDRLTISGGVSLRGGSLRVHLNFIPLLASFRIIDKPGTAFISGTFAGLPEGDTISTPRGTLRITYRGGDGNDVVLTSINTISTNLNTISRFPDRSVTPVVNEGGIATLTGTISDPDPRDRFFLDVNWGDGTPTEHYKFPPGSNGRQVKLTHRYLDDDPTGTADDAYTIQLAWHDKAGEGNTATLSTIVRNVAPVIDPIQLRKLPPSGMLHQFITFTDPGNDTWKATIDFGDGSPLQTLDLDRDGKFLLKHRYAKRVVHTITITLADDDGGVRTISFTL